MNFKFLKYFYLNTLVISLTFIAFNYFINPYNIFNVSVVDNFNDVKVGVGNNVRLMKAYDFLTEQYTAVILGASDAEVGLDPNHLGWGVENAYNLAVPGANIHEVRSYLEHAVNSKNINRVVLVVNLAMFNPYKDNSPDFDRSRLMTDNKRTFRSYIDFANSLYSVDATLASLRTLKKSFLQEEKTITKRRRGHRERSSGRKGVKEHGGFRGSFDDNFLYQFKNHLCEKPCPLNTTFENKETSLSAFEEFEQALKVALKRGAQVDVVIAPRHATMALALEMGHKWDYLQEWKRRLAMSVDKVKRGQKRKVLLWDFFNFNSYNQEVIVENSSQQEMNWFWEATHFRPELGDLILDKILLGKEASYPRFGILVDTNNIDAYLEKLNHELDRYKGTHRKEHRHLKELRRQAR